MFWANNNNCSVTPIITLEPDNDPMDGTRVRKEEYKNGKNNSEVVLFVIEGGGHTWPGGYQYLGKQIIGNTSHDINATEVICDFFENHSLR
jgi:polyhydroxybutyrate depolymerase